MKKLYDESELFDAIKDVSLEAYNNTKSKDPQVIAKEAWRIMSGVRFTRLLPKPQYRRDGNTLVEINTEEVNFSGVIGRHSITPAELLERLIDLSVIPQTMPFEHKEDMPKFIRACKVLFPNVDAYNVGACLTNFSRVLENIWANCNHPEANKQQITFYQYSSLGGTGKSRFHDHLRSFCDKYGINCAESNISTRWLGSEFSINLVTTVGEFFPPKSSFDAERTIINLNNIVDNTYYTVEYKQHQPLETLSKTTLFINSNKLPFDSNIRRYGIVRYNERPYSSYTAEEHAKYFADDKTIEQAFLDAFTSVPFGVEFVDEVQNVKGFEAVVQMYAEDDFSVFLTGSNSYLLSDEITTKLTGRYLSFEVYTLDFSEFLAMKKFYNRTISNDLYDEFDEYIRNGGFPKSLEFDSLNVRQTYTRGIIEEIFEKDVKTRNRISNVAVFERVQSFLINNYAAPFSLSNLLEELGKNNINTKPQTVRHYIQDLQKAKLLYECNRFDLKSKKSIGREQKYYLADLSLYFSTNTNNRFSYGPSLENIVYLYLVSNGYQVSIGRIGNYECDFIIRDKNQQYTYIQVTYSLHGEAEKSTEKIKEREYRPFRSINDGYPRYIISLDRFCDQQEGVHHINAIDLFIGKEKL